MSNHSHSTGKPYARSSNGGAASDVVGPAPYLCPACAQHGLIRIRRRLIDRILSLFVKQRRFRCTQPGCQWEGNLREKSSRTQVQGEIENRLPTSD
ncbi:MAG: hypothetical protein ACM3KD_09435 [Hyphomicrobiaceae bacterium]